MKYEVTMVITNTYLVDADNEEDAELKVRDLGVWDTLAGADFAVTDVEEVDNGESKRLGNWHARGCHMDEP